MNVSVIQGSHVATSGNVVRQQRHVKLVMFDDHRESLKIPKGNQKPYERTDITMVKRKGTNNDL